MKQNKKLPAFYSEYHGFKYTAVLQIHLYSAIMLFVSTVEKCEYFLLYFKIKISSFNMKSFINLTFTIISDAFDWFRLYREWQT